MDTSNQRYGTQMARLRHEQVLMSGRKRRRGSARPKAALGALAGELRGPDLRRANAPITFHSKADAEGWLGVEREEIVSGEWQPPVKVPRLAAADVRRLRDPWLRERDLKPRTREGYEHLLRQLPRARCSARPIDDITPACVRTWWAPLPADKPTVRARSYALLKAVMNTAVADEVIDSNPCRIRGAREHSSGPGDPPGVHRGARR